MSETHVDQQHVNGGVAPSSGRRRIARANFKGTVAELHFEEQGITRQYDISAIPGGDKLTGMAAQLLLYGAVSVLQTAYSNKQVADPVTAADKKWHDIMSGHWSPGLNYATRENESDDLALAFCEMLAKRGKTMTVHEFDEVYVPAYMKKTGIKSVAAAKRALGMNEEVAANRARILADRAKDRAKAARSGSVSADDLAALI